MKILALLVAAATLQLGEAAPDFELQDLDGNTHRLSEYTEAGKVVVLEWFNPDCPVSKAYHDPERKMAGVFAEFRDKDVVWLAINSGGPGNQGHGLERNVRAKDEYEVPFPILIDEDGEVGRLYGAKTTPHMYVIDAEGVLRYQGGIGNRRGGDCDFVSDALASVVAGEDVEVGETEAFGCSVKYAKRVDN